MAETEWTTIYNPCSELVVGAVDPKSTLVGFDADELINLRHMMQRNNLAMVDLLSALKDM